MQKRLAQHSLLPSSGGNLSQGPGQRHCNKDTVLGSARHPRGRPGDAGVRPLGSMSAACSCQRGHRGWEGDTPRPQAWHREQAVSQSHETQLLSYWGSAGEKRETLSQVYKAADSRGQKGCDWWCHKFCPKNRSGGMMWGSANSAGGGGRLRADLVSDGGQTAVSPWLQGPEETGRQPFPRPETDRGTGLFWTL